MTWSESVDEALAYGWIDGVRRSVNSEAYSNRFTPRRPGSNWSAVNIAKAEALIAAGRMTAAGLEAYRRRTDAKSAVYSYEQRYDARLTAAEIASFKKNAAAWRFFSAQPRGYRQTAIYWIASARQDATRARRFARLFAASASGRRM